MINIPVCPSVISGNSCLLKAATSTPFLGDIVDFFNQFRLKTQLVRLNEENKNQLIKAIQIDNEYKMYGNVRLVLTCGVIEALSEAFGLATGLKLNVYLFASAAMTFKFYQVYNQIRLIREIEAEFPSEGANNNTEQAIFIV